MAAGAGAGWQFATHDAGLAPELRNSGVTNSFGPMGAMLCSTGSPLTGCAQKCAQCKCSPSITPRSLPVCTTFCSFFRLLKKCREQSEEGIAKKLLLLGMWFLLNVHVMSDNEDL